MEQQNKALVIFKRILAIFIIFISTIFVCYACSAVKTVSSYNYSLEADVGSIYQSENEKYTLKIMSATEAYFYQDNSAESYDLAVKENVLFCTKEDVKYIFLAFSESEMFWQTKDVYLFKQV